MTTTQMTSRPRDPSRPCRSPTAPVGYTRYTSGPGLRGRTGWRRDHRLVIHAGAISRSAPLLADRIAVDRGMLVFQANLRSQALDGNANTNLQ